MKTLLLYVPITDPTSCYHSLSYLETLANEKKNNDIEILDTNIEALLYTIRKDNFKHIKDIIREKQIYLCSKTTLNAYEQLELYYSFITEDIELEELEFAIHIFRDKKDFYNYNKYLSSVEIIQNWMNALSVLAFPGQFGKGFTLPTNSYFNIYNVKDMSSNDILERIIYPFKGYFENDFMDKFKNNNYDLVGINVTYTFQLPFAAYIGRFIRAKYPNVKILFGGTEVSDIWRCLDNRSDFFNIFDSANACIIGEGETAFSKAIIAFENELSLKNIQNLIINPKYERTDLDIDIKYENISLLPTPNYNKLKLDHYLSPEKIIYYSPSRGCYWNRCAFCDYGLNIDSPTSPWRSLEAERIIDDISILSRNFKYIYFSVDVLPPSLLLTISKRLIEEKIYITWVAEIRFEENWTLKKCKQLKDSGCVAVSVGYESGNQRVLDLIDKGTNISNIEETIKCFYDAGIAVEIMGFTGFPTETFEDAMDSVNLLKKNRKKWIFGGLGDFILTKGSIVAREPHKFDISNVRSHEGDDIIWHMAYNSLNVISDEERRILDKEKKRLIGNLKGRPWVGGLDTPHTIFYLKKYGIDIMNQISLTIKEDSCYILNGVIKDFIEGYSIKEFFKMNDLYDILNEYEKSNKKLNNGEVLEVLQNIKNKKANHNNDRCFVRKDGSLFPFPKVMLDFLSQFTIPNSINNVIDMSDNGKLVKRLAEHCVINHFIKIVD